MELVQCLSFGTHLTYDFPDYNTREEQNRSLDIDRLLESVARNCRWFRQTEKQYLFDGRLKWYQEETEENQKILDEWCEKLGFPPFSSRIS